MKTIGGGAHGAAGRVFHGDDLREERERFSRALQGRALSRRAVWCVCVSERCGETLADVDQRIGLPQRRAPARKPSGVEDANGTEGIPDRLRGEV